MDKKQRKPGQGRKPEVAGQPYINFSIRMTPSQRDVLKRLGGAKWIRSMITSTAENGTRS